ncbi:hypothetical protein ACQHGV_05150 [Sphingomonas pseudosanguinis]|uniref:hypothetical protein n=1 Tax=Sphingomonas pseudosanguinis TaxID=413712 RepID=UPI003F834204
MAVEPDPYQADPPAASLFARVAQARSRAARRRQAALVELGLDEAARLSDQIRLAVGTRLRGLVEAVARDLKHQASRLVADAGHDQADAWPATASDIVARLQTAGLLHDPILVDELVAQAQQRLIADSLPSETMGGDAPSLLVRLTEAPDRIVATAARAVLAAEGHAQAPAGHAEDYAILSHRAQERLIWMVAAAMRADHRPAADRALAQAAERMLHARDEGACFGAPALRLATAIDARPSELPVLLLECLSDRQLGLFIALLAHALRLDDRDVREIVLEPDGDRLWLALRALDLNRATIARIGWAISEADRRRDVERFADGLDAVMAIAATDATEALALLNLPRAFRTAIDRLDGTLPR